jgi:hypothetical protein
MNNGSEKIVDIASAVTRHHETYGRVHDFLTRPSPSRYSSLGYVLILGPARLGLLVSDLRFGHRLRQDYGVDVPLSGLTGMAGKVASEGIVALETKVAILPGVMPNRDNVHVTLPDGREQTLTVTSPPIVPFNPRRGQ